MPGFIWPEGSLPKHFFHAVADVGGVDFVAEAGGSRCFAGWRPRGIEDRQADLAVEIEEELFEAAAGAGSGGVFARGFQEAEIGRRIGLSPRRRRVSPLRPKMERNFSCSCTGYGLSRA